MIFGKKDAHLEEKLREIEERVKGLGKKEQQVPHDSQTISQPQQPQNVKLEKESNEKHEEEMQVPLFVKLEKYKTIVSSLMQLKALLISLRNSLLALEQIERTRIESFSVIIKNLEKMNEKISSLEKEIVKPVTFPFGIPPTTPYVEYEEVQNVQASIASLKAQIDQLKSELERLE